MGLVEPSEPRGVNRHQHLVPLGRQPGGRPVPEKKPTHQEHHDRQHENQNRLAPPEADSERRQRGEDHCRQPERDGRHDVRHDRKRSANLVGLGVGEEVVAEHREQLLNRQHAGENRKHSQELPPHVLVRRQRRRVEDLPHFPLVVFYDRHPGGDGDEERVEEEHRDADGHADRKLRRDPRLRTAHRRVTALNARGARGQPPHHEPHDQEEDPSHRPLDVERQVGFENEEHAAHAHEATS